MQTSVRQRLRECLASGSKADRALASYILAKTSGIPFETAATLAAKVGVSEPTVGRFCRSLGYRSFKDLKEQLGQDIGDRPWLISDRLREFQQKSLAGKDQLSEALKLEMAGLVAVYEIAQSEEWLPAIKRLARAKRVFVAGFQTERSMAYMFGHQLQYLRDGVSIVDLAGGNFVELLATDPKDICLVIFEARRYSRLAALLASDAHKAGIPVTLVTDAFCTWGREHVAEMFVVPTEFNLFWDSTAQMAALINLMMNAISIEIGPDVEARMNRVSQLYSLFTGYVGDDSGPHRAS
ncbi:MAG: MurR/RpiR family transcriptional regulator [Proteobacteria bacterium]|nr:MurR/RpiR family transcriptional regulator [Pseudomonadota bacterium]